MTIKKLLSLARAIDKVASADAMGMVTFEGNHDGGVYVNGTYNELKRSVILSGSLADICSFIAMLGLEIWDELPEPKNLPEHDDEKQYHSVIAWDQHGKSIRPINPL